MASRPPSFSSADRFRFRPLGVPMGKRNREQRTMRLELKRVAIVGVAACALSACDKKLDPGLKGLKA